MRAVQWLWLWVHRCGVTDLCRLESLVRAAREADPIARNAPPNAHGMREKRARRLSDFAWDGHRLRIAEEEPGVLAERPTSQPAAADAAAAAGTADAPGYCLRTSQPKEPTLLLAATVLAISPLALFLNPSPRLHWP